MSYAPYYNETNMPQTRLLGQFRNSETDNLFEFSGRNKQDQEELWSDFPHQVFVGTSGSNSAGTETRVARVLRTVAYIVVDENADGSPVIEKWRIKKFVIYPGT